MNARDAIELVTSWLDVTHRASARARVAVAIQSFRRSETETLHGIDLPVGYRGSVSIHEASHAVVGYLWGAEIVRVRVLENGNGIVESHPDTPLGRIVGQLAGPLADLINGADESHQFVLAHSSDILSAAVEIAELSWVSNRAAATFAGCTVLENWEQINRVAVALNELGELDGATIAAFVARSQ